LLEIEYSDYRRIPVVSLRMRVPHTDMHSSRHAKTNRFPQ
jgi:hypothetical protein